MHAASPAPTSPAVTTEPDKRRWYQCGELWLLVAVVLGIHFTRLTDTMLQGEETRRATVALEMLRSADWIVPDLQGDVFFYSNRPPMQQWLIAILATVRQDVDAVAVRLPSAMAVLMTALLLWWYCRAFLSRLGAFTAGVAFASMGQVIELGSRGESDALFTLFVSASLLLWHRGLACRWPAIGTWSLAYLCVALATLTKGVQAPVYFSASLSLYLLVTRQWRFAVSLSHLAGIGVFLLVLGSWQLSFCLRTDLEALRYIYFGDVERYGVDNRILAIAAHMVSYPVKLAACLLPWSILIVPLIARDVRRATSELRQPLLFSLCAVLVTFPSVWLIEGAKSRFFMSLYPCFAVMVAVVVQLSVQAAPGARIKGIWTSVSVLFSAAMPLTAAVVALATFVHTPISSIAQPPAFAMAFLVASVVFAVLLWRGRWATSPRDGVSGVTCIATFAGLLLSGVVINVDLRNATDKVGAIERVKSSIPPGETLYSLGAVDHGFAYFYRDAIPRTAWPQDGGQLPEDVEYFVFRPDGHEDDEAFGFAWEPIALIDAAVTRSRGFPRLIVVARKLVGAAERRPTSAVVREYYLSMVGRNPRR